MKGKYIMKGILKKIIFIFIIVIAIIVIIMCIIKNKNKNEINEEYEPQEEISTEQERNTMISLYFVNKTTRRIEPEARLIDVKDLISNPYTILVNLLIAEPKNENLESAIPEGTILLGAELEGDTLILNFSEEFVNNHQGGEEEEEKTIESLVNTLTALKEVNSIKILINGEENRSFNDEKINFTQKFIIND
jgi:germination protein M